MNSKRRGIFEFDGTVYELYLLLGIEPKYDKAGNRIKTINELLGVKPLFTRDGFEVPRVLVIKNKIKNARVLHSNRLVYKVLKYKSRREQKNVEGMSESFLMYLDRLSMEFPMKFARGSKVTLKKVNKISKKYVATKLAKGSRVSLVKKKILIHVPPLPKKFASAKKIKSLQLTNEKTGKKVSLSKVKLKKKKIPKITKAKAKAKTKSASKSKTSSKSAKSSKNSSAKKKKSKSKGFSMKLGKSKEKFTNIKAKNNKPKLSNAVASSSKDIDQFVRSSRSYRGLNLNFDDVKSLEKFIRDHQSGGDEMSR